METLTLNKLNTIKIRPIAKQKFSGISSFPNSVTTLGCELGKSGYKTGLTSEEERKFEIELGLPKGTLQRNSNWWGNLSIRIFNDKDTNIDCEGTMGEIKKKILFESTKILNTPSEKDKWPKAEFMIIDPEAEAIYEEKQLDYEIEALEFFSELSISEKRGVLKLYKAKAGIDTMSEKVVKTELAKELKKDPKNFVKLVTDKNLKTKVLVADLVEYKIIHKEGNYFTNGDDPIGNSTEEVVAYLNDIKNQSVKLALESKLDSMKRKAE